MRRKPTDYIFAIHPPHERCPAGTACAAWCSRCNAVRAIGVPCSLADFCAQLKAFSLSHVGCRETAGDEAAA